MLHLTTFINLPAGRKIYGELEIPLTAKAIVIFVHGSGSSRTSPRNVQVAHELQRQDVATFLIDLLDEREARVDDQNFELRFNISFLKDRVLAAINHLGTLKETAGLPIILYGASTGAAAALWAAAESPQPISAVVSRGGRVDLTPHPMLSRLEMPVLLIIGGNDHAVLNMNLGTSKAIKNCEVEVVPGASHLFEERGAMETVSRIACLWILTVLDRQQA